MNNIPDKNSLIFSFSSADELSILYRKGIKQFVLSLEGLSREALIREDLLNDIFSLDFITDISLYLQADLLVPERDLNDYCAKVTSLLKSPFKGVRVQDPGILRFIHQLSAGKDIHLICETGYRNIASLKIVMKLYPGIKRFVLNSSLGTTVIKEWIFQFTDREFELLYYGDLPVFYSSRRLLKTDEINTICSEVKAREIKDNIPFKIVQSGAGTLIYSGRRYFADNIYSLLPANENLNWRVSGMKGVSSSFFSNPGNDINLYRPEFLYASVESVRFRNKNLERDGRKVVAEVLETKKREYMVVEMYETIAIGDEVIMVTPDGYSDTFRVGKMTNPFGEVVERSSEGDIVIMPFRRKSSSRSIFFRT